MFDNEDGHSQALLLELEPQLLLYCREQRREVRTGTVRRIRSQSAEDREFSRVKRHSCFVRSEEAGPVDDRAAEGHGEEPSNIGHAVPRHAQLVPDDVEETAASILGWPRTGGGLTWTLEIRGTHSRTERSVGPCPYECVARLRAVLPSHDKPEARREEVLHHDVEWPDLPETGWGHRGSCRGRHIELVVGESARSLDDLID